MTDIRGRVIINNSHRKHAKKTEDLNDGEIVLNEISGKTS